MMLNAVLLDTSFFIRFLNEADPLFKNAEGYFKYFIEKEIIMMISTISIAEYCVRGSAQELPLRNLQIVPFNFDHAKRAGEFAAFVFDSKGKLNSITRNIIPNDTKLFSQADVELSIQYYLSSDIESHKIYSLLKEEFSPKFRFIGLHQSHKNTFGLLDFQD